MAGHEEHVAELLVVEYVPALHVVQTVFTVTPQFDTRRVPGRHVLQGPHVVALTVFEKVLSAVQLVQTVLAVAEHAEAKKVPAAQLEQAAHVGAA